MIVRKLIMKTNYNESTYNEVMPVYHTRFNYETNVRIQTDSPLRSLTQRRRFWFGGRYATVVIDFELYPNFLRTLFYAIASYTRQNDKLVFSLTNSNSIPITNRTIFEFETFEGHKVQTNWGVLYELQLKLVADSFSKGSAKFVLLPNTNSISSVADYTYEPQITPKDLTGLIVVGSNNRQVAISSLKLSYQRKLEPKVSMYGYLEDMYTTEQAVEFDLNILDSSLTNVNDILLTGTKAKLQVQIGNLYTLLIPEFVVKSVSEVYSSKIVSISCSAVGDSYTQIQLNQL